MNYYKLIAFESHEVKRLISFFKEGYNVYCEGISKFLDLTEHTVRYYTDKELVPNLHRDKNNNRLFDDESVNWLTGVKYLKHCGMSVQDIKTYIELCLEGDSTIQERYKIILKQKEIAQAQLEEAKIRAKYMDDKANHYLDIIHNEIPDTTNPEKWDKNNKQETVQLY